MSEKVTTIMNKRWMNLMCVVVLVVALSGQGCVMTGGVMVYPAPVPKSGQTVQYQAGDDGSYRKGLAWPVPRFTVGAGGTGSDCVTDNMTGLIWARNANLAGATMTWSNAVAYCRGLTYGGFSDWRLPNRRELLSLLDDGRFNPALCNTAGTGQWTEKDPFAGVESDYYWSSSTIADTTGYAWFVFLYAGYVSLNVKTETYYVWPVRGGK